MKYVYLTVVFVGSVLSLQDGLAEGLITPKQLQAATAELDRKSGKLYEHPPMYVVDSMDWYPTISGERVFDNLSRLTAFSYESRDRGDTLWGEFKAAT